jgi:hypothetical protein
VPNKNDKVHEAAARDIDFLKGRFYTEFGCETNDVLTLFSYWQSNFGNQHTNGKAITPKKASGQHSFDNRTTLLNAQSATRTQASVIGNATAVQTQ